MAIEEYNLSYLLGKKFIAIYQDGKEAVIGTFVGWRDIYFYYLDRSNVLCEIHRNAWKWKFV